MKLQLQGHEYQYAVEQMLATLFPGEKPDYSPATKEEDFIRVSFREAEKYATSVCLYRCENGAYLGRAAVRREKLTDSVERDRLCQFIIKNAMYRAVRTSGLPQPPWGALTGVRPGKLMRATVRCSDTAEEAISSFMKEYDVTRARAEICYETTMETGKAEQLLTKDSVCLYIGIPFCPTRCSYCSFLSNPIAMWQGRVEEYLSCIKKELDFVKDTFRGRVPDTIYIGGGTPTSLSAEELSELMEMILAFLEARDPEGSKKLLEFTVEAGRPDSITKEKLRVLKNAGVDRISVNPQTMNDKTLVRIGRKHTVEQTVKAFELSREEGFDNINMDLILGLPGEGMEEIQKTMEEIIRMKPDSLTVHSLAIKRSAGMKGAMLSGEDSASLGLNRNPVKMMEVAYAGAGELNLNPYYLYRQKNIAGNLENVGFASEGKYGIYNILMMEEVQSIIALGAGTVSKKVMPGDIKRCDTAKDIGLYMDGIEEMIERKKKLYSDFVGHALDSRV